MARRKSRYRVSEIIKTSVRRNVRVPNPRQSLSLKRYPKISLRPLVPQFVRDVVRTPERIKRPLFAHKGPLSRMVEFPAWGTPFEAKFPRLGVPALKKPRPRKTSARTTVRDIEKGVCEARSERREVLFAMKRTGGGAGKRHVFTQKSLERC